MDRISVEILKKIVKTRKNEEMQTKLLSNEPKSIQINEK